MIEYEFSRESFFEKNYVNSRQIEVNKALQNLKIEKKFLNLFIPEQESFPSSPTNFAKRFYSTLMLDDDYFK